MSNTLPDYKRRTLEHRKTSLIEEYEAINQQLESALAAGQRLRLKRQLDDLERQIQEIEVQLA